MNIPSTPAWTATPASGLQINSVAITPDGALSVCGTSNEYGSGQFGIYAYGQGGQALWQCPVTGPSALQGVFWVAVSADKRFAAAGGESAKNVGFLVICDAKYGKALFNTQNLPGRVNQVSFSADGSLLLVVMSSVVQLYRLQLDGTWALRSTSNVDPNFDCVSGVISADGSHVWLASVNYQTSPYTGQVTCLQIRGGLFSTAVCYPLGTGAMRVATTPDGVFAAASLHSGSCVLFSDGQATGPLWTFAPDVQDLSLAYAVDITQTSTGSVVVACGVNQQSGSGLLYVVDTTSAAGQWSPSLRWSSPLQYAANPGVSLDREAVLVTATDGKPSSRQPNGVPHHANAAAPAPESPGNFYLFDGQSGAQLWKYPTPIMNWPMVITPDGSAVLGGSDDGTIYCWMA